MKILILTLLLGALCSGPALAAQFVVMETNAGDIVLELDDERAPLSVANFLKYAEEGFYNDTIFHRVIKGFMIQGGGFGTDKKRKATKAPIRNEAANGLKNDRGTIAMARTSMVDSATSQFFINHVDNPNLNHRSKDPRGYGYAVFGRVIEGMEVVDKIAESKITRGVGPFANLPAESVVIKGVRRLEGLPAGEVK